MGVEVHRLSPVLPRCGASSPAAADEVLGPVELEEEQPARRQGLETSLASGPPEVDLLDPGQAPQEAEPVVVRDPDPELHVEPIMKRGEGRGNSRDLRNSIQSQEIRGGHGEEESFRGKGTRRALGSLLAQRLHRSLRERRVRLACQGRGRCRTLGGSTTV